MSVCTAEEVNPLGNAARHCPSIKFTQLGVLGSISGMSPLYLVSYIVGAISTVGKAAISGI